MKNKLRGLPKNEIENLRDLFSSHGSHICQTFRDDEDDRPVLKVVVSEGYERMTEWLDTEKSELPLAKACPSIANGVIEVVPSFPKKSYKEGESRFIVLEV